VTKGKLEPHTQELLKQLAQRGMPLVHTLTPTQARESRNPVFREMGGPPPEVRKVENFNIPGPAGKIPLRGYIPEGSGPLPVLLYFHGGGWVIGSLETHDSLCRALANGASCAVVSVDYRLAPEHKFPAAIEDAYAATQWTAENARTLNFDPTRIAVCGDSAGGNMAAVVSLMARDNGAPSLAYQVLIYPVINLASFDTQSYRDHGEGYILTRESMKYYRGHYRGDRRVDR
jgi:acetyl esterase